MRKDRYDPGSLLTMTGGRYYGSGGFRWRALIAQAVGMVAATLWLNASSPYVGPLASRVGGPPGTDFGVFLGLLGGGAAYWLLARRTIRAEGDATGDPASYDLSGPRAGTS